MVGFMPKVHAGKTKEPQADVVQMTLDLGDSC